MLTIAEVNSLVFGILLAGYETTTNASSNIVRALLVQWGPWDRLRADLSLIPNAVEEGLRFASSVVNWWRVAEVDVETAGIRVPAGSDILLGLASANREEAIFDRPDELDVARTMAGKHLSFGHGIDVFIRPQGAPKGSTTPTWSMRSASGERYDSM